MLISAGPAKDLRKKPSWTETLGASVAHPVRAMQAGCSRVRPSALCDAVFSKPWAWCHHYKRGPNVCFDSSLDYMVSVGSMRIPDLALSLKQLKIKPFKTSRLICSDISINFCWNKANHFRGADLIAHQLMDNKQTWGLKYELITLLNSIYLISCSINSLHHFWQKS